MKLACAITTAPRKENYFDETRVSIEDAGFQVDLVSHDNLLGMGSYRNFKRTVLELLDGHPNAEAIVVFQDDIRIAKGTREWVESSLWPDDPEKIGVVSLYTAEPHHMNRSGWHKLPLQHDDGFEDRPDLCEYVLNELKARGKAVPMSGLQTVSEVKLVRSFGDESYLFSARLCKQQHMGKVREEHWKWFRGFDTIDEDTKQSYMAVSEGQAQGVACGACAYLMPRESARLLVEKCRHPESRTKTDIHVAETCQRLGLSYWMHTPSLVEHIGAVSTLHDHPINTYRRAGQWCRDVSELGMPVA